jgi:hypothetical protein
MVIVKIVSVPINVIFIATTSCMARLLLGSGDTKIPKMRPTP